MIKHFFLNKIAHSSYILAESEVCAVIWRLTIGYEKKYNLCRLGITT